MNRLPFIVFLNLLIVFTTLNSFFIEVQAHSGSRDELGGHFRNKDCVYILHEPTSLALSAKTKQDLLLLIKKHNQSACSYNLIEEKIDLDGTELSGSSYSIHSAAGNASAAVPPAVTSKPADLQLENTYKADLHECTDGDTASFNINGQLYKTRFLYIDTPESTSQMEPYGKEASQFTCSFLKTGQIMIETDGPSLFDKYDRLLAWVWVDNRLLQEEITNAGLVEDFYDYGDYKYEGRINQAMAEAKSSNKGIYSNTTAGKQPLPPKTGPSEIPVFIGLALLIFIALFYLRKQ
ncbi:thermonuclease family protein [Mesobacillus harenae]|uniref:thermonuclease family protein n=1 Tax=Mesobacillus harenae TaxID=2213203 RepID=UPI003BB063EF